MQNVSWNFFASVFWLASLSFGDCNSVLKKLASHETILRDLRSGQITEATRKRINGNTHDLWWVTLRNEETGNTRQAILKPREWGDSDGWARSPMELVAYELNRLLGMDYIPPTVYRRNLKIRHEHIHETPVIHLIPSARVLYETPESAWGGISKEAVQSDHRILCVLLHNSDGHAKNLLLGEHWVDGENRPAFIDFGASLRPGTQVTMRRYPAPGNSEPVSFVRKKTLHRLKKLSERDFEEFRKYLTDQEMSDILKRRDGIVAYFQRLISENGFENVVLNQ